MTKRLPLKSCSYWKRLHAWSILLGLWQAHNKCNKGVFLSLFSCTFDDQLSQNFHRFIICIMFGYTKWKNFLTITNGIQCLQRNIAELIRTKSWRSLMYRKRTRSNDDVKRKHPLKYFGLKCHMLWEINKTYFPFGVYRSVSVLWIFLNR